MNRRSKTEKNDCNDGPAGILAGIFVRRNVRARNIEGGRKRMDIMKKRWLILIASCFVTLCVGSLYAWSVFASPMAKYLSELSGKEIASLAIVFTVANAVGPITMISGGFFNDRIGPKWVLVVAGILFGAGMIGSGFATSLPMLIVTYGLGVGLGCGMAYGTIVSNAVKFFPDKSGFAGGITTACYGGSSIIIPIIANAMLGSMHVTKAFKILGAVMMVIIVGSAFVIEAAPAGFTAGMKPGKTKASAPSRDMDWHEMTRQKSFYLMLMTLTCGAFAGMMIISQASPIAQQMMGFTPAAAAAVVSLLALFNMLGRLASGTLSDRLGALGTMRLTFGVSILAGILLFFCKEGTTALFYIGLALAGFGFGSIMGIYPGFTAKTFGRKYNSVNYGIMFIGFALAGILGPMIMNAIKSGTGNYQGAFLVAAALGVVGEILIALLGKEL